MQDEIRISTEDKATIRMYAKCNLAIVLADIADSLMLEFEAESKKQGKELKKETKQRFGMMTKAAKDFRVRVKDVAKDGYKIRDVDSFCDDSDWLKEVLMLVVDRTGGDKENMVKLRSSIFNMKSEMGICN